jgi:protein TonB
MSAGLADFTRYHRRMAPDPSSRAAALVLTALLFGGFAFLFSQPAFWSMPDQKLVRETVMRLLPDAPRVLHVPPPPFIAHLIKPRAEAIAPPSFTIASDTPAPRAALPVTAVKSSPLDAGVPAGTGTAGQGAFANGSGGNGKVLAACLDPVWMQAASDRVRRFLYYPQDALARHVTGLAKVHVIVRRNGYADLLEIGTSSGSPMLDAAAYNIVHRALPLPALPDRMHTDQAEVLVPIDFGTGYANAPEGTCRD